MSRLVQFLCLLTVWHQVLTQKGTTPNLESIVMGRCVDYSISRANSLAVIPKVNCTQLWMNFSEIWTNQDSSCNRSAPDFNSLFRNVNQVIPADKSLFWSGMNDFAHKLSYNGRRYITLEDTLLGFSVNDLTWCGQVAAPGINYTGCPPYNACPSEVVFNYWITASKWFAENSVGHTFVVLNGSNPTRKAYRRNDSIFGSVEIPNMRADRVTKMTALLVHDLDKPWIETCGQGSLLELKDDITAKQISFECLDNPESVKSLLCTDNPSSLQCRNMTACSRSTPAPKSQTGNTTVFLTFMLTLFGTYFVNINN